MARIPYPEPAALTPAASETLAKLPPLNVFRMMSHAGDLVQGFARFGNHLLAETRLDPVLRELAIVRTGLLCGSDYEVQQHNEICRRLGMSDALIAATREGAGAVVLNPVQSLVLAYTDDVVLKVRASDAHFDALSAHLDVQEMMELTVAIGFYMMVSRFLETFEVDLETAPEAHTLSLPGMA